MNHAGSHQQAGFRGVQRCNPSKVDSFGAAIKCTRASRLVLILLTSMFCGMWTPLTIADDTGTGYLQLEGPSGLTIKLDGVNHGVTSKAQDGLIISNIASGSHELRVEKNGYDPYVTRIVIKRDKVLLFSLKEIALKPTIQQQGKAEDAALKPQVGEFLLQTIPIACIIDIPDLNIDGAALHARKTHDEWRVTNIPQGMYRCVIKAMNKTKEITLEVRQGEQTHLFVNVLDDTVRDISAEKRKQREQAAARQRAIEIKKRQIEYAKASAARAKTREETLRKISEYPLLAGEWFFNHGSMKPKGYKTGDGWFATDQWFPTVRSNRSGSFCDRLGRPLKWRQDWDFLGRYKFSNFSVSINGSWRAALTLGTTSQSATIDYKGNGWDSSPIASQMAKEVNKMRFAGWRIKTKAARFDPRNPRASYSTYYWLYQELTDKEKLLFEAGRHPRVVKLSSDPLCVRFDRSTVVSVLTNSPLGKYLKAGDVVSVDYGPGTRSVSSTQVQDVLEKAKSGNHDLLCLTVKHKATNTSSGTRDILFIVPASLWDSPNQP